MQRPLWLCRFVVTIAVGLLLGAAPYIDRWAGHGRAPEISLAHLEDVVARVGHAAKSGVRASARSNSRTLANCADRRRHARLVYCCRARFLG